jgi:hypothetical protein
MDAPIHTFQDGSTLHKTMAKELIKIPIWKGNRILDTAHVAALQKAIGNKLHTLDSGYRIVEYEEEDAAGVPILRSYLIDGQHRAAILKDHYESTLCEPDFPILVTIKRVEDESGAIDFFNIVNHCKPQAWKQDPNLVVNKYIAALVKTFNVAKKVKLIRPGSTHRPYLSTDKLRETLLLYAKGLNYTSEAIRQFVERVQKWNVQEVGAAQMQLTLGDVKKEAGILQKSVDTEFMLAFDPAFKWIHTSME